METCAAVIDKTEFPGLLKGLWEELFEAKHFKAGFRKAGLCLSQQKLSLNVALHPLFHTPYHHPSPRLQKKGTKTLIQTLT